VTYYFRTKEEILLAVFDRLLELMYERARGGNALPDDAACQKGGWEFVQMLLAAVLRREPQSNPEFHSLQYTFLSQIAHREDFRLRLAKLYEEWRSHMAEGLSAELPQGGKPASPRAVATLVQAVLHGLSMQLAADPESFDREEMLDLCLDLLGSYLQTRPRNGNHRSKPTRRKPPSARPPRAGLLQGDPS